MWCPKSLAANGFACSTSATSPLKWHDLVPRSEWPNLYLHDPRHTGNTLAASWGASLKDLMTRMGHDSPAAALIYQHATRGRRGHLRSR